MMAILFRYSFVNACNRLRSTCEKTDFAAFNVTDIDAPKRPPTDAAMLSSNVPWPCLPPSTDDASPHRVVSLLLVSTIALLSASSTLLMLLDSKPMSAKAPA